MNRKNNKVIVICKESANKDELAYQLGLSLSYIMRHEYSFVGWLINDGTPAALDRIQDICDKRKCKAFVVPSSNAVSTEINDLILSKGFEIYNAEEDITNRAKRDASIIEVKQITSETLAEKAQNISVGVTEGAKQRGSHSNIPYGYVKTDDGIKPDEEKAKIVSMIFELAKDGLSNQEIATKLQELGIASPKGGTQWSTPTILRILSNSLYTGEFFDVENHHESIVDKKLFDSVQIVLLARSQKRRYSIVKNNDGQRDTDEFGDMLRCGKCGSKLDFIARTKDNRYRESFYRCAKHTGHNPKEDSLPEMPKISLADLKIRVLSECNDYIVQPFQLVNGYGFITEQYNREIDNTKKTIIKLGREVINLQCENDLEFQTNVSDIMSKYPGVIDALDYYNNRLNEIDGAYDSMVQLISDDESSPFMEEFDIKKVKRIMSRIKLMPNGDLSFEYQIDIKECREKFGIDS